MTTATPAYELNRPVKVCRYCGADPLTPTARDLDHASAKCVEGDEPSYKMGGPA